MTYHGPGQLVGYPILRLHSYGLGASDYMHRLEEVIVRTLGDYGLVAHRRGRVIGVWVGDNKIACFGVRIKRAVTLHGFALNVAPNMRHWSSIIPCGITEGGVTSMAVELQRAPDLAARGALMSEVHQRVASHFEELFDVELVPTTLNWLRQARGQLSEQAIRNLGPSVRATDLTQWSQKP